MFDLFGDMKLRQEAREVTQLHAAHISALIHVLIAKGIVTEQEWNVALNRCTAAVDQAVAKSDEERVAEFDEKHPNLRKFLGGKET